MKTKSFYIGIIYLSLIVCACAERSKISPAQLTCEYMENPSVVDIASPRLSWINETASGKVRGEYQQAYRICVASSEEKLLAGQADVWDSNKVPSRNSYLIPYAGSVLQSTKDYWWRVMVWDSHDTPSEWSAPARWGMGLLTSEEWKAQWIGAPWQGEAPRKEIKPASATPSAERRRQPEQYPWYPAPLFRKAFQVKSNVASAKAFVTGLGFFEFYMNGTKVGDDCLVPNLTNYTSREGIKYTYIAIDNNFRGHRVMYLAYDITDMLREQNVAGAIVGDGFYDCTSRWVASFGSPRFLCQIEITYEDGSKELVCSDNTWKVKESPLVMNGVYDGELYDANRETEGWSTTACDDSHWDNVVLRNAPTGELTAHTAPTDKVTEQLKPITLTRNADGNYEVDFGVEISGWIRFRDIQGSKGDTLNVKYICESPLGIQQYIFKDSQKASYAPRFTWYVFSKAVISGIKELTPEMLIAEAVNTDVAVSAEFKTSNAMFNRINTIWQRSQIDNMHGGIASDCPHRERSAYTGDGQVACVTVMHNFDAAAFYNKWIRDMRDAQNIETGYIPNGAPWQPGCGGGVPWGAAMNIMPWEYYLHYGDLKMLEDSYTAMKEHIRYMRTWLTPDGTMFSQRTNINSDQPNYWLNLGDWAPSFKNPSQELVHTFYLWRCADLTAKAAKALKRDDDRAYFSTIAEEVKTAFHKKFYNADSTTYGDFGSNIYALKMGVPAERYHDVVKTLHAEIVGKYNGHLNTGIYGTQFFFETLAENGMNEVAYGAMNKKDFPSYGHWLEQGATVTWEQWNGESSHNHPMFGGGLTWFYRTLAGVNTDENEPGYRHIVIKPQLPEQLNDVYYSNMTPYGKVISDVKRSAKQLEMNVTIPVGSHATIHIPASENSTVTENGTKIDSADGIDAVALENGYMVVKAGQGNYRFVVK
jgi:alpha-L-rhamnosidase